MNPSVTLASPPSTAASAPFLPPPPAASPAPPAASTQTATGVNAILSPPNGVPTWQTRQVSECAFDFVHWELVSYWSKQVRHLLRSEEDERIVSKKINHKLETMGFGIGQRYVERYSKDHPLQEQPLDIVKFMCKEFWTLVYKKQIDKLQTNYKGIYVLHDFNFRWLTRISALNADTDQATLIEQSRVYTSLACGIIRGALHNLGLNASVKVDITKLPAVQFTIVEDKIVAQTNTNVNTNIKTNATAVQPTSATPGTSVSASAQPPRPTSGTPLRPSISAASILTTPVVTPARPASGGTGTRP